MAKYRQYYCVKCKNHAFYPPDNRTKRWCGACYAAGQLDWEIKPVRRSVESCKASIKKRKCIVGLNRFLLDLSVDV
jgi:hypothetical protein